ncbi:hypothetical protein [Agrobacterium sp. CG674]
MVGSPTDEEEVDARGQVLGAAISSAREYQSVFQKLDAALSFQEGVELAKRTLPVEIAQLDPDRFYPHTYKRADRNFTSEEARTERKRELLSVLAYRTTSNDYTLNRLREVRLAIDAGTFRLTEAERAAKIAEFQRLSNVTFQDGLTLQERRSGETESGLSEETLAFERSHDPDDRRIMRRDGFTLRGSKRPGRGRKRKVRKTAREKIEQLRQTTLYLNARQRWWLRRVYKACRMIGQIVDELEGYAKYDPLIREPNLARLRKRFRYEELTHIGSNDHVRLALAAFSAKTVERGSKECVADLGLAETANRYFSLYENACKKIGASYFEKNEKIKSMILNDFYLSLSVP